MAATTDRARAAVANRTQTAPAQQAITLKQRIGNMEQAFALAMPRGAEATQLVRDALTCLSRNPKLEQCEASTVLGALMTCAQLGLRPGVLGHAWLLPFWDKHSRQFKAQLVIGYQGYAELAHRTGMVDSLIARPVHANDTFSIDYGLADSLVHKPQLFGDRGPVIAYYAIIKYTTGGHAFHAMSRSDVEKHRDRFAMARNKQREVIGPWVDHFDAMALKTVYLQLQKWAPKSTEMARALSADGAVRDDLDLDALDVMPPAYDLEGEVVADSADDQDDEPPRPVPAQSGTDPAPVPPNPGTTAAPAPTGRDRRTAERHLFAVLGDLKVTDRDERLAVYSALKREPVGSTNDLDAADLESFVAALEPISEMSGEDRAAGVGGLILEGRQIIAGGVR
jgi:recombination protein RecT